MGNIMNATFLVAFDLESYLNFLGLELVDVEEEEFEDEFFTDDDGIEWFYDSELDVWSYYDEDLEDWAEVDADGFVFYMDVEGDLYYFSEESDDWVLYEEE